MIECCRRPATEVNGRSVRLRPLGSSRAGPKLTLLGCLRTVRISDSAPPPPHDRVVLQHAQQAAAARDIAVEGESANITIAGKLPWSPPTLTEIPVRQLAGRDGLGDADLQHNVHCFRHDSSLNFEKARRPRARRERSSGRRTGRAADAKRRERNDGRPRASTSTGNLQACKSKRETPRARHRSPSFLAPAVRVTSCAPLAHWARRCTAIITARPFKARREALALARRR